MHVLLLRERVWVMPVVVTACAINEGGLLTEYFILIMISNVYVFFVFFLQMVNKYSMTYIKSYLIMFNTVAKEN